MNTLETERSHATEMGGSTAGSILIAEDDPTSRKALGLVIRKWGYDVIECANGLEALRKMQADGAPRLAILDWMMPGLDGLEVCLTLRQKLRELPPYLILLTAKTAREDKIEALEAGADDFITKPFNHQELRARIRVGERLLEATNALRRREENYRAIFDKSPTPMWLYDFSTLRFLQVNEAALGNYGYSAEEFLSMQVLDLCAQEDRARMRDYFAGGAALEACECKQRRKDGSTIIVHHHSQFVDVGRGRTVLVVAHDVTEQRTLEEGLRHAQRVEVLSSLAGGVAHDFNNILGIILGYSELLLEEHAGDLKLVEHLSEIREAAKRGAGLTGKLLALGCRQVLLPQIVNLQETLLAMQPSWRDLAGENIVIEIAASSECSPALIDTHQLEQVMTILVENARDAMPRGGVLRVETQDFAPPPDSRRALPAGATGNFVRLSISDTGTGMNEMVLARLFNPFFTTKGAGCGKGLGLSTVQGIIHQSGGHITVSSEPGQGSRFDIYLPAAAPGPPPASPAPEFQVVDTCQKTILFVENEDALRKLITLQLERSGCVVCSASSGVEALQLAEAMNAPPQLLITDVIMPQMSGRELAQRLHERWPRLKTIYISGYTGDEISLLGTLESGVTLLQKPFEIEELLKLVHASIPSGASSD